MVTIDASPSSYKDGIQCNEPFVDDGFICELDASSGDWGELSKFMLMSSSSKIGGVLFKLNDLSCDDKGVGEN